MTERFPAQLYASDEERTQWEAYNPGFMAGTLRDGQRLVLVRLFVPLQVDPDTLILSAMVGDRPFLPVTLPAPARVFMKSISLETLGAGHGWRPEPWNANEWIRMQIDRRGPPSHFLVMLRIEPEPIEQERRPRAVGLVDLDPDPGAAPIIVRTRR